MDIVVVPDKDKPRRLVKTVIEGVCVVYLGLYYVHHVLELYLP